MYISFENPGELDIRAARTFGVSVKESENPIGFFGTGLKYAIAIFLRTHHEVVIQSGEMVYTFAAHRVTIRGEDFDLVTCNGDELSFTTDLGKSWEVWMAYRELMANAKDEGGGVKKYFLPPDPESGLTRVIVHGDKISEAYRLRRGIFLDTTPILSYPNLEVHQGISKYIFYRGCRIFQFKGDGTTLYTYNIMSDIALTEDRTAKYFFEITDAIKEAVIESDDEDFIRSILVARKGSFEEGLMFHKSGASETFISVVEELINDRVTDVNSSAVRAYKAHTRKQLKLGDAQLSLVQQEMLYRALNFIKVLGVTVDYEILVTDSLGAGTLGMVESGRIFLALDAFRAGTKQLAATILEEYIHIKHDVRDETRQMQEVLLMMIVSLGEELRGEPV